MIGDSKMLNVLNLGAGVQSSVLALMLDKGELGPKPDVAIHADTKSDPPNVSEMVEWLSNNLSYPVNVVSAGNVAEDLYFYRNSTGQQSNSPPLYIKHTNGKIGMGRRQCTREYKLEPIKKEMRRLLGLKKGQWWPKEPAINSILGISTDEIMRAKDSDHHAIIKSYPLIEAGLSRQDCMDWWENNAPINAPKIGRSACYCCPYQNTEEWQTLKEDYTELFYKAVVIDKVVRKRIDNGEMYLHASGLPLQDAIETKNDDISQFDSDCEGMCGI